MLKSKRKIHLKNIFFILLTTLFLDACRRPNIPQETPPITKNTTKISTRSNSPKREFRAAWIATIDNIDWPSRKGLSAETQQQEFRKILDFHKKIGINAVFVQVRAASDAFYAKSSEPWSEWLTGEQGKNPVSFYDPMRFMIFESHQHGMEFHAWLNMNRGNFKSAKSITKDHITNTNPEWFLTYGGTKLYNFGIPEVREYIVGIVLNIVKNYDVDGIHFDDYFYPYAIAGEKLADEETFKKYTNGFNNIDDWRRENINLLVEAISKAINLEKPRMKFGISPFGVWRNKSSDASGSDTKGGLTSYDNLYADTKKWLKNGWIDYIAPQIYFSFEHPKVPYQPLADWWSKNDYNRHIYIGHSAYKVDAKSPEKAWKNPSQIPRQIRFNRSTNRIEGSIFFSTKSLINNQLGLTDSLENLYKTPALLPTMPWKDNVPPSAPKNITFKKNTEAGITLSWEQTVEAKDVDEAKSFVIYRFNENENVNIENPAHILQIVRNEGVLNFVDKDIQRGKSYIYVLTALDRLQNESSPSKELVVKY